MPITQLMVDIWHFLGRKVATLSRYPKRAASDSGSHDASSFTSGGDYFVEYEFVDDDLTAMENPHESIGVVNESVPSSDGPLIGKTLSTQLLHEAYAGADPPDPTFTAKTENLLKTCPSFRSVRGDGSCGFRAMLFSYIEVLLRLGNGIPDRMQAERDRIQGMTEMLHRSEYAPITWEEWVETTIELLDELMSTLPAGDSIERLEKAFNDEGVAPALVQHFRMLTSCWINENASLYKDFLPEGMTIDQYRQAHIDPANAEMEELSLKCAYDLLLDGAGMALEISYLDRSPGDKVNTHLYEPQAPEGKPTPDPTSQGIVKLLYRPGHYDILYGPERT